MNIRSLLLFSLLVVMKLNLNAQTFQWAKVSGGVSDDIGNCMALLSDGSVFTAGVFNDTMALNPGVPSNNVNSAGGQDIFITKRDANGNFLWGARIGGIGVDSIGGMCKDDSDNVFLSGSYSGTVDFNPAGNTFLMSARGNTDNFILKLNSSGQFLWAKSFGGTDYDEGHGIVVNSQHQLVTTGLFSGSADFDPSTSLWTYTSNGYVDGYVATYNAGDGSFLRAWAFGGPGEDLGSALAVDATDNIYVTGWYSQTVDFNPDTTISNLLTSNGGSIDVFTLKLDNSYNFQWVNSTSGPLIESANGIAVDGTGSVYVTGGFQDNVNFDPFQSQFTLTNQGFYDGFLLKYNSGGQFQWIKQFGGPSSEAGYGVTTDASNAVYVTGCFTGTVTFNNTLTSSGGTDIFIAKYDPNGNCTWNGKAGGSLYESGKAILVDGNFNLYVCGQFQSNPANLDPTGGTFNANSNGGDDVFTLKVSQPPPCTPAIAISASPSGNVPFGTTVTFTAMATNGGSAPLFQWYISGVPAVSGNGNTYTTSITSSISVTCTMIGNDPLCPSTIAVISNTINVSNTTVIDSVIITPTATNVCLGSQVSFMATPYNGGSSPSYGWYVNGNPQLGNSAFFSTVVNSNLTVRCELFSSLPNATPNPANSNIVYITANTLTPAVQITGTNTQVCPGTSVSFNAVPTYPGSNPVFTWYVNGVAQAGNSPFFTTTINSNSDILCSLTSDAPCANPTIVNSNVWTVTANTISINLDLTVTDSAVCPGSSVTFTATPSVSDSAASFQWYINGAPQAGNNSVSYSTTVTSSLTATCTMTSSLACVTPNPVSSNPVTATISLSVQPAIAITGSANAVCSGATVNFTANPSNGGSTPVYAWYVNGNLQSGNNGSTFSTPITVFPTAVYATMISSESCASSAAVTSNTWSITYSNSAATPTINLTTPQCILTSSPAYQYQWLLNSNPVPNATGQVYQPTANGFYQVQITEPGGCSAVSSFVLVTCVVGINEVDPILMNITPYPNPANDRLLLDLPPHTDMSIDLFTMDGRWVMTLFHGRTENTGQTIQHNIKDLPAGLYTVYLRSVEGMAAKRVAVMH